MLLILSITHERYLVNINVKVSASLLNIELCISHDLRLSLLLFQHNSRFIDTIYPRWYQSYFAPHRDFNLNHPTQAQNHNQLSFTYPRKVWAPSFDGNSKFYLEISSSSKRHNQLDLLHHILSVTVQRQILTNSYAHF